MSVCIYVGSWEGGAGPPPGVPHTGVRRCAKAVAPRAHRPIRGPDASSRAALIGSPVRSNLEGDGTGDARGEDVGSAATGDDAVCHLRSAETGSFRRDDHVARQEQLQSTSECPALDGRDEWLVRRCDGDAAQSPPGDHRRLSCQERLQVHSGREHAPCPRQDRDLEVVRPIQLVDRGSDPLPPSGPRPGGRPTHPARRPRQRCAAQPRR